jgi:hypothetical protein
MIKERKAAAVQGANVTGPATRAGRILAPSVALHAAVLLLYTLLAVFVTWPMVTVFGTGMMGLYDAVDAYQCAWNLWWVSSALIQGRLPFFTWLLYYPYGVDLFWQTTQFSQAVAALPVTLLFGPAAGVNWTVLTSFIVGGYVTFLFARRLTGHTLGSFLAGVVFAFSPFHMQKVVEGGLEVTAIHWVACFLFALYLLLERPNFWRSLLAGALLLWVSLGSWYYGLFGVMITGCAALIWLLVPGETPAAPGPRLLGLPRERWIVALWGVTPALWWVLILAPRLLSLAAQPDTLFDLREIQALRSADLMDFFLPNPLHPLWGAGLRAWRNELYPNAVIWNVALGWVGLALGLLGAVACWQRSRRWFALLCVTLVLAMGPSLQVVGADTGLPLPFALLRDLPGFRANQRPSHMVVFSTLLLALLAAYGLAWLCHRLSRPAGVALTAGAVALLLAFDAYAGPMTMVSRPVHPFYSTLPPPPVDALGRPVAALLPLPLYVNINRSENLTPQTVHGWPILAGYIARPPEYDFARYTPGVRELEGAAPVPSDIVSPGWPALSRQGLAAYGIRYVTFDLTSDKDDYFALVRDHLAQMGFGAPLVADPTLEVYEVPPDWPVGPLGFLGAGWNALEQEPPYRWRWMGPEAELRLYNPLPHPVLATLSFTAASFQEPRPLTLRLDGRPLTTVLVESAGPQSRVVSFLLEPGEHTLLLDAPASPDAQRAGAPISVRLFAIDLRFQSPD